MSVHFLVAGIAGDEVLLGHPFLVQAHARLDFGNHCTVLFGEDVPYSRSQNKAKTLAVRVARTVLLEVGEKYVVPCNTRFRRAVKREVLLSPTKGFVEKHKVLVARAVVEAQPLKVVPLRIFNPGNTAITIKKGAVAGVFQTFKVLPSETPAQLEQTVSSSPVVPHHLQELYAQSSTELNVEEQHQLAQLLATYGSVFSMGPMSFVTPVSCCMTS